MKQGYFSPPVIAHRGASAYAPENTCLAFLKAIQMGVKWVEFDVQLSKTGEVVVFHDAILDRTTNGRGRLKDYPYRYLQTLDAGKWFDPCFSEERIPSLQETLRFLVDKGISCNIELKPEEGTEEALVKAVFSVVDSIALQETTLLYSSFCLKTIQCLRTLDEKCNIGLLMHTLLPNWPDLVSQLNLTSVNVNHSILTETLAHEVKSMRTLLTCYTVNDSKNALQLYSLGVDALFTDMPDIILAALTI